MSIAAELIAGGVAGAAGILLTQPMDTIRIRLQSTPAMLGGQGATPYTGILNCAKATAGSEGIRGLYKGVASPTLTVGGMNAVLFFSYEWVWKLLSSGGGDDLTLPQVFVAGATSGLASAFITSPTELVKCIAQTNVKNEGNIHEEWQIFRNMIRDHGVLGSHGPTRGLFMTICRETPSFAMYFTIYEAACRQFGKSHMVSFHAGGFAGAFAWATIYPIDVIKTRWQVARPGTYSSILDCYRQSVAAEGRGMLWKGSGATMARAWPQNAVIFFTYESVKKHLAG